MIPRNMKYVCDAYLNKNQETGYSSTSEEDLIAKELEMLIDKFVGGMPEQRRMIYTLSRNEGLSNADIDCNSITAFLKSKNIGPVGKQFEMIKKLYMIL